MRYTKFPKRKTKLKERFLTCKTNKYAIPYYPNDCIQVLEPTSTGSNVEEYNGKEYEWGFGGGTSGLSIEEMKILNKCFNFRAMGAYEYEKGNIKKSLDILLSSVLIPMELDIFGHKVWVVGFSCHKPYIQRSLEAWIVNNQFNRYRMHKENFHLDKAIVKPKEYRFVGLWDTKNNFIVLAKKGAFDKLKKALILLKQLPTAVPMVNTRVELIRKMEF